MAPRALLAILLFAETIFCFSARKTTSDPSAASHPASTQMQHLVRSLSGKWSIDFTFEPTGSLTKGGKGHGEELWKPGPGALSLFEEYHSVGDEGELTGHGTFWWDQNVHRFQVLWCANDLPSGCTLITNGASWEGNQLVLQNEIESAGKKHLVKEVFSDISPTSFTQTIYQGETPATLKPAYVFHAKKKLDPPSH